jgi:glycyl-tRNA synthetase
VPEDLVTMDKIVALCKRRGLIFPASEIYGGIGNTYDYGHYGVLLKNNVKEQWWKAMVQEREDIVALDSAIIQHPRTWQASGHLAGFTDPLVDCRTCKQRFRADHLADAGHAPQCPRKPSKRPGEHIECDLTEAREFNLMFETTIGPIRDEGSIAYLRPETAQGIFLNFRNVLQFARKRPAQVGKSFRNEITPGNFIFRTREFEQMEMEFFVAPADAQQWYEFWCEERYRWYVQLGIRADHLRLRAHEADELSHYSSGTSDVEYLFPIGWQELEGISRA